MNVFIITNAESGWDCVRGAFLEKDDAVAFCADRDGVAPEDWNADDSMNIIHEETLDLGEVFNLDQKRKELRMMELEDGIAQAQHTISFMHGCLTDPMYKYAYPEHTLESLQKLNDLYAPLEGCGHSMRKKDCPNCVNRMNRNNKMEQLRKEIGG